MDVQERLQIGMKVISIYYTVTMIVLSMKHCKTVCRPIIITNIFTYNFKDTNKVGLSGGIVYAVPQTLE